jgi:hypothetical protein
MRPPAYRRVDGSIVAPVHPHSMARSSGELSGTISRRSKSKVDFETHCRRAETRARRGAPWRANSRMRRCGVARRTSNCAQLARRFVESHAHVLLPSTQHVDGGAHGRVRAPAAACTRLALTTHTSKCANPCVRLSEKNENTSEAVSARHLQFGARAGRRTAQR